MSIESFEDVLLGVIPDNEQIAELQEKLRIETTARIAADSMFNSMRDRGEAAHVELQNELSSKEKLIRGLYEQILVLERSSAKVVEETFKIKNSNDKLADRVAALRAWASMWKRWDVWIECHKDILSSKVVSKKSSEAKAKNLEWQQKCQKLQDTCLRLAVASLPKRRNGCWW